MAGPLDGVRILDLTTVVMGPYATQILADFGADVVKVEPPEGDIVRLNGPARHPGMGHIFLNTNRNKRSIVLDLKKPAGLEAALALAKTADVLVYNVRPQAMARLGLAYEGVRAVNPRSGVPWLMQKSGADQPRYVPATYADRTVGLHLANAVTAALFARERTGQGQRVDVPMFESLLQTLMGEHLSGRTFVPPMPGEGYARVLSTERKPYRTKNGWVCVLVYNDKQWRNFFELIGEPEMYDKDPRFCSQTARIENIDAVYGWFGERMAERTTAEWLEGFAKYDIPAAPMNTLADVFADPHLRATGYFGEVDHPTEGRLTSLKTPSEWSATPPQYRHPAPRLGEHTREILREAGYDDAAIEKTIAAGAARQADAA